MNRSDLKNFAINARLELIRRVSDRAAIYGIDEKSAQDKSIAPSDTFHKLDGTVLTATEARQRDALVDRVYQLGYRPAMEEAAYTWFNRIVAIKYMQEHNLLPVSQRVLPDAPGALPQLLQEAQDVALPGVDIDAVLAMLDGNRTDALYKYLVIALCNALSETLPGMFEKISTWAELLFPDALLKAESVLGELAGLSSRNADCWDEIQVIGWLYQYYNTELNAEVYDGSMSRARIPKELLPAATTIYTPDWPVHYMVENSLGRLWLEGHPDAALREKWRYYMDEAEQPPEVAAKLAETRRARAALRPEDVRLIDPCMGSGHILAYAFDVLMDIYRSQGYTDRDAVRSIVENNLYGLDIDDRAAQLAYFCVMMKACQYDRRFLRRGAQPHVCAIQASGYISEEARKYFGKAEDTICRLHKCFDDAKEFGSLIRLEMSDNELHLLDARIAELEDEIDASSMPMRADVRAALDVIKPLVRQAHVLVQKYDVVVTNPPYLGSSRFSVKLDKYVKENYPDEKADLSMAMFRRALNGYAKVKGYTAFITTSSWMFLSSFEKMRKSMLQHAAIITLMDLGTELFDGKVGHNPIVAWVNQNDEVNYKMAAIRLVDYCYAQRDRKEPEFFNSKNRYFAQQDNFSKIPGSPVAYWVSERMLAIFQNPALSTLANPRQGLATGENDRFLRSWFEVALQRVFFHAHDREEAQQSQARWFPYNKGGDFRKWYGNNDCVVNWENDGNEIRNFYDEKGKLRSRPQNMSTYFMESVTWSKISSGVMAFRYKPYGHVYDVAGTSIFARHDLLMYLQGFCNSCIAMAVARILSPTINYEVGHISNFPIKVVDGKSVTIQHIVEKSVALSKNDWDSFETSWDFKSHPLI